MTALDSFFSKQISMGRAALVAACIGSISPALAQSEHYDISKLGGVDTVILDGEAQHYLAGAEGKKTLSFIVDHLNDDMDALQRFASGVSVPALASPSSKEVAAVKSGLKTALAALAVNNSLREDFDNLAVSSDMPDHDAVLFLTQRANQRAGYIEDMEMRLKEMQVALTRRDYRAVATGLQGIRRGVKEQEYVEDGLRRMGFETGR